MKKLTLLLAILIMASCKVQYRTEPYKPSMNPVKAYWKKYNKHNNYPRYDKL